MQSRIKYRRLNSDDYGEFYSLFQELLFESPELRERTLADRNLKNTFYHYLESDLFVFGAFDDRRLVGVLVGVVFTNDPFSNIVARDILTYVRRDVRPRGAFVLKRLLDMFIGWARERSAKQITMSVSSGIDSPYVAILRRWGYRQKPTIEFDKEI